MISKIFIILYLFSFSITGSKLKFRELKVIPCIGQHYYGIKKHIPSAYLSNKKLEILDNNKNKDEIILCDIIPIPILDEKGKYLVQSEIERNLQYSYEIQDRDGGLYDNLPYFWIDENKMSKKKFYDVLIQNKATSSMKNFMSQVQQVFQCSIKTLIVEVADEFAPSENHISIGATILLSRFDDNDKPLTEIYGNLKSKMNSSSFFVNCFLDELITIALALEKPICIEEELFQTLCIDAKLIKQSDRLSIISPTFLEGTVNEKTFTYPAAWEILDPKLYFTLSSAEKRAILRASNIKNLPRPREGEEVIDKLLLDNMDEAVSSEIYRLAGKMKKLTDFSQETIENDSRRQTILQDINIALQNNDINTAIQLRDKFSMLTSLRADPTQPEGSYDQYLDQDEWYMQKRKRAMGS